ncbi:hypothetical protein Ani05nite_72110 [Amorphoplanes nipponensis]|uniref:Uncharacterized protein n=2 Tax=Actinoplanes nipponensis TaxID=135950 RepID=A0A919MQZ3_9ACTN|nr:hypothetical protein Ani05nite_72110 [Actinoplanes nipponensis]
MMGNDWQENDNLLRALDEAVRTPDPTPPAVLEAARAVYTWRTVDAELAELVHDSRAETAALAGLRAEEAELRTLSFAAPGLTVELGVSPSALLGLLVPPGPAEVTLRLDGGQTSTVPVDEDGCFRIAPPPVGLFSVACELPGGRQVVTSTFRL